MSKNQTNRNFNINKKQAKNNFALQLAKHDLISTIDRLTNFLFK